MKKIFFILVVVLPFPVALNLGEGVDLAVTKILVPAVGGWWLVSGVMRRTVPVAFHPVTFLLAAFLFLAGFSFLQAGEPLFTLRKLVFLFAFAPLFFFTADLAPKIQPQRLFLALSLPAGLLAFLGIGQFLLQFLFTPERVASATAHIAGPIFWGKTFGAIVASHPSWFVNIGGETFFRALAIFPDPHTFAIYLGMILPFPLAGGLFFQDRKLRSFLNAISLLIFTALLLTFSRGGYAALLVSGAFFAYFSWRFLTQAQRRLTFLFSIPFLFTLLPWNPIGGRFFASFHLAEGSFAGRLSLWKEALTQGIDSTFFGIGLGNFPRLLDPLVPFHSPINAHNMYLELFLELGFLGPLLFSALLLSPILFFVRWSRRGRPALPTKRGEPASPHFFLVLLPITAALVFFATHSLFETTIYSAVNFSLLLLFLGWSVALFTQERGAISE